MASREIAPLQHLDVPAQVEDVAEETRAEIVKAALAAMEAGSTLNAVAMQRGVAPSTIWRWLQGSESTRLVYDQIKVKRSRALIEHGLYELQHATTLDEAKVAEKRAKYYLLVAAKLNPKEFGTQKDNNPLGTGPVTFVLNMGGQQTQQRGELTAIPQPEDGDLT